MRENLVTLLNQNIATMFGNIGISDVIEFEERFQVMNVTDGYYEYYFRQSEINDEMTDTEIARLYLHQLAWHKQSC